MSNIDLKSSESSSESDNKLKRKKKVAFSESLDNTNNTKKICISDNSDKPSTSFTLENSHRGDNNLIRSPLKGNAKTTRIKQTMVREFPGPAGLLPDDVSESDVIDLDKLDEKKDNKNKYAEVCSQNTKNLFTTGAWQLMMDDLPAGIELDDIASVSQNALDYSRTFKKIPYMAGIIQKIDYKPNDPHIELKDLSGKIDARIHHSICKLYPNAFGTGIVILLKDVGVIRTSKKYVCLIISPKSLVSGYSEETRLIETPYFEQLLNNSHNNLQESQISILDENKDCDVNKNSQLSKSESSPKITTSVDNSSNNTLNVEKYSVEPENVEDVHDFDLNEDDSWLGVDMEDFNLFKAQQFPSSTPMCVTEKNVEKEDSEVNLTEKNQLLILKDKEKSVMKDDLVLSRNSINLHADASECSVNNQKSVTEYKESFKYSENDTDDEMLSQLDVDTIAASYKG